MISHFLKMQTSLGLNLHMDLLQVKDLNKRERGNLIVRDVSLAQTAFEKIAIAGETGSGKTTLLKMIGGLIQPDSGEILFEGERVPGPFEKLIPGHPGVGYLSQQFELPNHFTVRDVMELVNKFETEYSEKLFRICRIDHLLNRRTNQLSGGERQRIALARVLSTSPRFLLLDEPFSNLDLLHKNIIRQVIIDIGTELGITCLLVSHDVTDILSWADRVILMKEGSILQQGNPEEVYHRPKNDYVAALFGDYNLIDLNHAEFSHLQSKFPEGKRLFIRPEEVSIKENGEGDIKAVLQKISFRGNYYLLETQIGDTTIIVQSSTNFYQSGDQVGLSFSPRREWHF